MRIAIRRAVVLLVLSAAGASADTWMCTPTVEWDFSGPEAPFEVGPDHPMFPSTFAIREISLGKFTKQDCVAGRCDGDSLELVGGFTSDYKVGLSFSTANWLMTVHPDSSYSIAKTSGHWVQLEIGACTQIPSDTPTSSTSRKHSTRFSAP